MDLTALIPLAFVASITPGPNNLMLLASGMNHGARRSMPHLAGVSLGFAFLLFVIALGLGSLFERFRAVELLLTIAGAGYLLVLAWRIFTTDSVAAAEGTARPLTFLQAAAFQWVNPKAWVMGTTATSTLLDTDAPVVIAAAALAGAFWVVNLPCISTWLFSGVTAARWVDDPVRLRRLNRFLGVLLALTVVLLVS
ncbi:MAG: LysE family translocator [Actinomycetota bacterium]